MPSLPPFGADLTNKDEKKKKEKKNSQDKSIVRVITFPSHHNHTSRILPQNPTQRRQLS
jgi:hypothetical protein